MLLFCEIQFHMRLLQHIQLNDINFITNELRVNASKTVADIEPV